jgi:hypothetical protein
MADQENPELANGSTAAPSSSGGMGSAQTSESAHDVHECVAGRQITAAEGVRIVAAAAQWAGTRYALIGERSERGVAGDCSGSTHKIYLAAGFPYVYQMSSTFVGYATTTHRFVEITGDGKKQPGDVLWWPGHVAVYAEFSETDPNRETSHQGGHGTYKTTNNMWTAHTSGHEDYGPFDYRKFRPGQTPRVFRYFLHHGEPGC